MLLEGAMMIIPAAIAGARHEDTHAVFLITLAVLLALGLAMVIKKPKSKLMYAKEGFLGVVLSWVVLSLFGTMPFYFSGEIPSFIDALFETVSGFSTTGATILTDVEALPVSLLFWRSMTQWIGGMGVLMFMLAILPMAGSRSIFLARAELPGPTVGKLVPKMRITAIILYVIYIGLTLLEFFLLLAGGMSLFDSAVNALATAGTGGYSVRNAGIAYYNSAYFEGVITVFMILFGVNFNVYFLIILRRLKQVFQIGEVRAYIAIILVCTAVITVNILPVYGSVSQAFRYSSFQVGAVISSTCFNTANFDLWPQLSRSILLLLMFVGSCTVSTGGGFKILRVMMLFKSIKNEIRKQLHPRSVSSIYIDKKPVGAGVAESVNIYFAAYFIILVLSTLLLSLDNFDMETNITSAVASLNNMGPGLGRIVGPTGNFSAYSWHSKLVLCFDMLAGRLEIIPVITLLSSALWRRRRS
jgi:trk system potassium uptake protein TrkH